MNLVMHWHLQDCKMCFAPYFPCFYPQDKTEKTLKLSPQIKKKILL